MVGYALSLATTRPSLDHGSTTVFDRRLATSAAVVVLGPVIGFVMGLIALLFTVCGWVGLLGLVPLLALCGRLIAEASAAGAMVRRRFAVPAALLPGLAGAWYLPDFGTGLSRTMIRPTLLWDGIMAVVLIVVGLLPRPISWWAGYAGVVGAAWAAVTWAVWLFNTPGFDGYRLDPSYAWLWFPASFGFVSAGPGPQDAAGTDLGSWYYIVDFTEIYPHVLLGLGVYMVGYLVGVCEHRDFP
jgi:hypothetical protein